MTKKLNVSLACVALAAGLVACGGGGGGNPPNVGGSNQPPVAAALLDQTVLAGSAFSFTVPAYTDGNGDVLTYTATKGDGTALPSGLTFNPATRTFSATTALDVSTPLSVKVTATDPSATSASATFTLSSVAPGVFKYASQVSPGVGSVFYGVVFPSAAGTAEVWTWEFDTAQDFSKLYKSQLSWPATGAFTTVAANRRTSNSSAIFSHDASVVTTVSRGATGVQNFNVGGSARTGNVETVAWQANADYSSNDWLGNWLVTEQNTTITHAWTVDANGAITGSRKNGSTVICTVDTSANASMVTLLSSPVSRIKVTEVCGSDSQVLEGISFVDSKTGSQVTNRVVLLNGSGGTTPADKFVTNIATRQ